MYCYFPNAAVSRNVCIFYCEYTTFLDPAWRADTTTTFEILSVKYFTHQTTYYLKYQMRQLLLKGASYTNQVEYTDGTQRT